MNSDTQLLDPLSLLRRITSPYSVLLCQTRLQPLIPSQLLSYLPLYTPSSLKLLQINCYPSEFSALIQVPIFSYRWYLPASLSMKKVPFFFNVTHLFLFIQNLQVESIPFFNLHPRAKLRPLVIFLSHYSGVLYFRL